MEDMFIFIKPLLVRHMFHIMMDLQIRIIHTTQLHAVYGIRKSILQEQEDIK